jgi:hypothetical protein
MTTPQSVFTAAMMDAAAPVPEGLRDHTDAPAGRRFSVYRNNVAHSLTEALITAFPVITRLLGEQNMRGLAGLHLRAHPPRSPLMMHYGQDFPAFVAALPQLQHLGYLADVARLELAMRASYHAADAAPLDPAAFAALPPDELMAARLTFAPSMQLLRSDWPLYHIWRYNMIEGAAKPTAGAQDVLITRAEFDPQPQLLPTGGADWIQTLQSGATLADAQEAAAQADPGFDLGALLALLLQGGAITTLDSKG